MSLDSAIVEAQSREFQNVQSHDDVERALERIELKGRFEGFAAYERNTNQTGALRDAVQQLLRSDNDEEDGLLYIIASRFNEYRSDAHMRALGKGAAREYVLWATRGLLPPEKVERALARALLSPHAEERFSKAADRKARLDRLEVSIQRRAEHVIKLGIDPLDELINSGRGIPSGEILHIVGGEGGGKTSLLLNILTNYVRQGGRALFLSMDMSPARIEVRLLQRILNCSQTRVHDLMKAQSPYYQEARRTLEEQYRNLVLTGDEPMSLTEIRDVILASDADLVAIDYATASTIRTSGGEPFKSSLEQATAIADFARGVVRRWGLTVVLLSQVSRESGRDRARGGTGGHAMGGSALEQLVDYEIELFSEQPNMGETKPRTIAELRKNRNGVKGRCFELNLMTPSMEFGATAETVERASRKSLFISNFEKILK